MSQLLQLQNRKRHLNSQISTNRTTVRNLEKRITRLKSARTQVSSALNMLRSSRNRINRVSIGATSWRGNRKNNFDKKYDRYKSSVKTYVTKVEDSRDRLSDEIKRIEAQRSTCLANISSMQNTINTLNTQIGVIERAMRNG
ncbi:protein of unknown function [Amphibacillus marinus]|uniref:Uncharacterized protein n=1 Tax=Amphibacillus marinus TaxID=872970 RepID=A0A1H8TVE4_9BACI|nr:DUF5082 family protein [Amphibacillus marinus]SEO94877.1 protein of unknown function [Amphibacillus marinus]